MPTRDIENNITGPWPRGGIVPVPNVVLDHLMPTLRDTELRVLLVVIRQTLGWQEQNGDMRTGNQRKWRDYISHSQLCRKTGRASAAVSAAVDSLIRQNLIVVEDVAGRQLYTPEDRRRHLGQQFFRMIGPALGITSKTSGNPIGST